MSCAVGEPWGTSAERMKFPLWKPLCAPALVKSAIKSSVLNTFFNDVLNSEVSKCRSWAFDIKLIRTTGFFSLHCKNPTSCFLQNYIEAVNPLISCLNATNLFSRCFLVLFLHISGKPSVDMAFPTIWGNFIKLGLVLVFWYLYGLYKYSLTKTIIKDQGPECGNPCISCFQAGFWRNWCLVAPIVAWHVSAQGHC